MKQPKILLLFNSKTFGHKFDFNPGGGGGKLILNWMTVIDDGLEHLSGKTQTHPHGHQMRNTTPYRSCFDHCLRSWFLAQVLVQPLHHTAVDQRGRCALAAVLPHLLFFVSSTAKTDCQPLTSSAVMPHWCCKPLDMRPIVRRVSVVYGEVSAQVFPVDYFSVHLRLESRLMETEHNSSWGCSLWKT